MLDLSLAWVSQARFRSFAPASQATYNQIQQTQSFRVFQDL